MDLEVLNLKADASSVDKATASVEDLEKKLSRTERAVAKAEEALKILRGELVQVGNRAISLGDGFTKSQANMLAMLKQAGATTTELKAMAKTMDQLNKITSTNPFDKSVQALNYVKKQREELTKSIKYAERYNDLTKEQISLMTRGIESVRQRAMSEQKNFGEREAAVKRFIKEFVKEAQSYNQVTAAIEEKNRVAKEELRLQQEQARAAQVSAKQRADAERYVQETLQRTLFINEQMDKGMSVSGANALYAYKQQLDVLGLSAEQTATKMQQFQNALMQKQTLQGNRSPFKQMSEDVRQVGTEVNQLARAVSVQMGDVFVSLAGGMNPFLVAIQQGDQVRFALEQAAAAGQSMDKVMQGAFKSMANSFILVGKIVSDFLIDGFKALGGVFNGLLNTMPVFGNMITGWEMGFKRTAAQGDILSKIIVGMAGAANIAIGAMMALGAFIGGVYLNALIKADQQQSQLAKSLGQYGASLGVAIDEARAFAVASEESTGTVVDAIGAIAKAGGFTAEQMKIVAVSAAEMNRVFGTSIDDIISKYKDLQKDPVKALLELQARTGDVNETLIIKIRKMQEEGREYAAIGAAMEEYAAANKRTTDRTVENLGVIATVLSKISEGWRLLYKEIESLAASPTALENLLKAGKEVEELRKAAGSETDKIRQEVLKRELAIAEQNLEVVKKTWVEENKANELRRQRSELAELELKHTDSIKNAKPAQIKFAEKQLELQNDYNRALERGASPEFLAGLSSAMQKNADEYLKSLEKTDKVTNETTSKAEKYYDKLIEKVNDLSIAVNAEYDELFNGAKKLTSANKELLDAQDDKRWKELTEAQKAKVKADLEELAAKQELIRIEKERIALVEFQQASLDIQKENAASIAEETKAIELRNKLLFATEKEAKKIQREYDLNVKLASIENKYIADRIKLIGEYTDKIRKGQWSQGLADELSAQMQESVNQEAEARRLAHEGVNTAIKEDYAANFKEIQGTVTDIIATAMFEGGKAGSKKLKDVLEAEFRNYVIDVLINPIVGNVMGGVSQSLGLGNASQQGGATGMAGLAQTASSAYNLATGSTVAGISGAVQGAGAFLGSSAVSSFGAGMTMTGTQVAALSEAGLIANKGAASLGSTLGAALPWVAGGLLVADLLGAFDKKPSDKTSWAVIDPTTGRLGEVGDMGGKKAASEEQKTANTQLSQLIGGFAGLAGITGQIVTAMGSRDGIRLALASGFKTPQGAAAGGAWLGGQTAYNYGSDPATAAVKMMEDLLDEGTLSQSVIDSWNALKTTTEGVTKDAVELVSNLNLLVAGYDEQSIKRADLLQLENEALETAYARMLQYEKAISDTALPGDALASAVKSLFGSFTRLNVEVPMSNKAFSDLIGSLDLTTSSGQATYASLMNLIPAFLELQSAQEELYNQLLTDEQRAALLVADLSKAFNQLGVSMPLTRDEMKALIDAQDATTEAGAVLKAQLLALIPAFVEMTDTAEEKAKEALENAKEALEQEAKAKEDALKALRDSVQTAFDVFKSTAESEIERLKLFAKETDEALSDLKRAVDAEKAIIQSSLENAEESVVRLKNVFEILSNAILELRSNVEPTSKMLYSEARGVISSAKTTGILPSNEVLEQAVSTSVSGVQEQTYASKVERERAFILLSNDLEALQGVVKPQLSAAERQVVLLTLELEKLDLQLEQAEKLIAVSRGIEENTYTVGESVKNLQTAVKAEEIANKQIAAIQYQINLAQSQLNALFQINTSVLSLKAAYDAFLKAGDAYSEASTPVKAFASGGAFTNGIVSSPTVFNMGVMGEDGSEAIMPLANVGGSLGVKAVMPDMSGVIEEIQALRGETSMLRAEVRAVASNTSKSAKLLDRAMPDGQSILVTTA